MAVKQELYKLTGKTIDRTQIIIINYFYRNTNGNTTLAINHYPYDNKYKRYVKKNPGIAQFFMTEKHLQHKEDYVYEDKDEVIKNLLFKYPFEANYIILKPNGKHFRQAGEYKQDEIAELVKSSW